MTRAWVAALLLGAAACAPPTQYRGLIRIDHRGVALRLHMLCLIGLARGETKPLCGPPAGDTKVVTVHASGPTRGATSALPTQAGVPTSGATGTTRRQRPCLGTCGGCALR